MKAETAVLDIQGQYRVYTEHYRADAAEPEHDEPQQALTERPLTGIGRHQ